MRTDCVEVEISDDIMVNSGDDTSIEVEQNRLTRLSDSSLHVYKLM